MKNSLIKIIFIFLTIVNCKNEDNSVNIENYQQQINQLQQTINEYETTINNLSDVETTNTNLNQQITDLNEQLSTNQTTISDLQSEINRLSEFEIINQELYTQITNLESQIQSLNEQVSDLTNQINSLQNQNSGSQTSNTTDSTNSQANDTTPPVISINGDASLELNVGDTYTDAGASASDDTDGDLTGSIITSGSVDTSISGTYTITYTVTDAANNSISIERVVTVNETAKTFTVVCRRSGTGSSAAWILRGVDRNGEISGVSNGSISINFGDTLILDREEDGVISDRPYIMSQSYAQQREMTGDVDGVTVTASTVVFNPISVGTFYIRNNSYSDAEATIIVN